MRAVSPSTPTENTSSLFVSVESGGALLAWPGRRLLLLGLMADWDALAAPGSTPGGAAAAAAAQRRQEQQRDSGQCANKPFVVHSDTPLQ